MSKFSNFNFFVLTGKLPIEIIQFSKENNLAIFTKEMLNLNGNHDLFICEELPKCEKEKDKEGRKLDDHTRISLLLNDNDIVEFSRISEFSKIKSKKSDFLLHYTLLHSLRESLENIGHGEVCEEEFTFYSGAISSALPLPNIKIFAKLTKNCYVLKLTRDEAISVLTEFEGICLKLGKFYLVSIYSKPDDKLCLQWDRNVFTNKHILPYRTIKEAVKKGKEILETV